MRNLTFLFAALLFALLGCDEDSLMPRSQNFADQAVALKGDKLLDVKKVYNFRAHLDHQHAGTDSKAQGQVIFQVKDGVVYYKLIVANLNNVTMAHIHLTSKNGAAVVWLYPSGFPPQLIEGTSQGILAEGTFSEDDFVGPLAGMTLADLIEAIVAGDAYVNIHTQAHGGGEISGVIF